MNSKNNQNQDKKIPNETNRLFWLLGILDSEWREESIGFKMMFIILFSVNTLLGSLSGPKDSSSNSWDRILNVDLI